MKIDMSAFVGREFDCEFFNDDIEVYIAIGKLRTLDAHSCANTTDYFDHCRPRLNKPQVLDDCSWLPDGFVWDAMVKSYGGSTGFPFSESLFTLDFEYNISSKDIQKMGGVIWIECLGLQEGYELEGMEVVE